MTTLSTPQPLKAESTCSTVWSLAWPDWMVVAMLLAKIALQQNDRIQARAFYKKGLELAIAQEHAGPEEEIRAALAKLEG